MSVSLITSSRVVFNTVSFKLTNESGPNPLTSVTALSPLGSSPALSVATTVIVYSLRLS